MNQLQDQSQKKLFKYYIDKNIERQAQQKNFYFRVNRWRYNSLDRTTFWKVLRPTGPLILTIGVISLYDWTYGFLRKDGHH